MKNATPDKKEPTALKLVNAATLAARYGVASKTIRRWGADGFFPVVKLSRRAVRYPLADCDRIIESRRIKANSEA